MSDTLLGKQSLVHYNAQHIQVRKDFLDLCVYDKNDYNKDTRKSGKIIRDEPNQECMAKILRLIETLTDSRKSHWQQRNEDLIAKKKLPLKEPAEYRIELAYPTIVRLLYNTYGESTVRNSVAALLQMGYIIRYQKNQASTSEYVLNIPLLQTLLQNQMEEGALNVTPSDRDQPFDDDRLLNVTPQDVENNSLTRYIQQPDLLKTTANNIESNTTYKKGNKSEGQPQQNTTPKEITRAPEPLVKSEAIELWDGWMNIVWGSDNKKKALPSKDDLIDATVLVKKGATEEDLRKVRDRLWGQDDFWKKRDITLKVIIKHFNLAAPTQPPTKTTVKTEQQEKKPTSIITSEEQTKRDAIRQKLGKIAEGALNV